MPLLPEGGLVSLHPDNSASQLARKALFGGVFPHGLLHRAWGRFREPKLTGEDKTKSTRLCSVGEL